VIKPDKLPRDVNARAARIVAISTGQIEVSTKNPAAVALGRLGGLKGGKARAAKLSAARLKEIGKSGAAKRWGKKKSKK
jgi:hypothetical protein